MTFLDHGLVVIIAIVYPLAGFFGFRRLLRRAAAGESVNRLQLYRNTLIGHWTLFFVCIAMWAGTTRPWSAMGLGLKFDLWFAIGAVLTILGIVVLVMQIREVRRATHQQINGIRQRFGKLSIIIPQNGSELARFYGLAVTAGIVEEIL